MQLPASYGLYTRLAYYVKYPHRSPVINSFDHLPTRIITDRGPTMI